ncbi:MAG: RNA polymerase sigma factor [Oscillospiraceae bacterium]|nr:RNA polymerase sigma factor [Oscillospiraceae bacterium]
MTVLSLNALNTENTKNFKDSIEKIYQRHVKTVYRVCFTYMKNAADTEDATADTFVKLLKSRPAFTNEEHEKAWLIRTAGNVCKDKLKHWWRNREDIDSYSQLPAPLKTESGEPDVTEAVLNLPDKYKTVVYLYYYEGYTTVEISKTLKKPQSTIRNYLHEARNLLKERLGDYES